MKNWREVRDRVSGEDTRHHFRITVEMRGHDADWSTTLEPQEIRAYSLPVALHVAYGLPLSAWMPPEEDE